MGSKNLALLDWGSRCRARRKEKLWIHGFVLFPFTRWNTWSSIPITHNHFRHCKLLVCKTTFLETAVLVTHTKGAPTRFAHLEKFSLIFSNSSFVIRVNLPHPSPSLIRYGLLSSLWCFPILANYYFQECLNLQVILQEAKATQTKVTELLSFPSFLLTRSWWALPRCTTKLS